MFVRNGQALGSVQVEPKAVRPKHQPPPPEPVPATEPAQEVTETEGVQALERPKDYDNKPEWVEFAVSKGADRDEAEGLTKPELIEHYGGED